MKIKTYLFTILWLFNLGYSWALESDNPPRLTGRFIVDESPQNRSFFSEGLQDLSGEESLVEKYDDFKRPTIRLFNHARYQKDALNEPVLMYPIFSQEEAATPNPSLVEREDIEYVGKPCCQCDKALKETDDVISLSCGHLIHKACISSSECPECSEDIRGLLNLLSRTESDSGMISFSENYFLTKIQESQAVVNQLSSLTAAEPTLSLIANLHSIARLLCIGQIPEAFPPEISDFQHSVHITAVYLGQFQVLQMYALIDAVTARMLATIIGSGVCLEVCAGRGWLARALREQGVSITATDIMPLMPVTEVLTMDAVEAINHWQDIDYLIISWPPLGSPIAFQCVQALADNALIIYIGEWQGGACADDDFFDSLEIVQVLSAPTPAGIKSSVYIARKKKK